MALSVVRALLAAQLRSLANRIALEGGGGRRALPLLAGIVLLVLAAPAWLAARLGAEIGALGPGEELVRRWVALQAVFTLAAPLLAAARYRPLPGIGRLGALPVPPVALIVAELPAALLEVFPLLAAVGIVASNVGLATGSGGVLWPLALASALHGLLWLPVTTILAGASWVRLEARRGRWLLLHAAVALAALARLGGRESIAQSTAAAVGLLPGSWLVTALGSEPGGRSVRTPALLLAAALAATAGVALVAVRARIRMESAARESRRGSWIPQLFARTRRSELLVAGLLLGQVVRARAGRALLVLPLLLTAPVAIVLHAVRFDRERLGLFTELVGGWEGRLETLPWYAITIAGAVFLSAELWFNPFGWLRGGVRTLLVAPLPAPALARGLLSGLGLFTAAQALFASLPLLLVRSPNVPELAAGGCAGLFAIVALGAIGQAIGLQFPRAVDPAGSAAIPFRLSWIPTLCAIGIALPTVVAARLGSRLAGEWGTVVALGLLALLAVAAFAACTRLLADELARRRDRLVAL